MKTVTLTILILFLLIVVFNMGCAVYYKGFKPIVSADWGFPVGKNTFRVFATLEGEHEKETFHDSLYSPCFSISDRTSLKDKSLSVVDKFIVDSVQLRYNKNGIILLESNVFFEREHIEHDYREVCFGDFIVPPQTDTLWLTLYLHVPKGDSLVPFSRTWSMKRDDWVVHTLHND